MILYFIFKVNPAGAGETKNLKQVEIGHNYVSLY